MKKLVLKFIRRFYNQDLTYADKFIEERKVGTVTFTIDIILNGIIGLLVILSVVSLTPATWPKVGPGFWYVLNVFQIGLVLWFFRELINFLKRKK